MSTEQPKTPRTEARKPRGLPDRSPADIRATNEMLRVIQRVYELYGFEPVETPFLEYTDALGKFLPDQDRPNAGVFSLRDDDEQWMSLRYDLTAPLARYCAENWQNLPKPYRSYRAGWVFRNEKPGPGRFRQFMQFDADTVGAASVAADAEICMMAADTLKALGIPRGQYVIKVNNRKILDGVMEAIGLGGEENAGRRLTVLRAIDKLDKFSEIEVRKLLQTGRLDESGDYTKGAGLNDSQADNILMTTRRSSIDAQIDHANGLTVGPMLSGKLDERGVSVLFEGLNELSQLRELVASAGYGPDRIRIDPSVVRGLEYYTGPVFEAELLFEVKDEEGKPIRFGSVGGGGRYDGLVSRFLDEPVPATGFSIGVSRLLAALQALGKVSAEAPEGPVIVTLMPQDRGNAEAMASLQQIVSALRNAKDENGNPAGIPAELYLGPSGLKAQFKYADRRNSRIVLTQGEDERKAGVVQLKDLILGATLTGIQDRQEYLAKQAEAQFPVAVADIVAKVREVLARHR